MIAQILLWIQKSLCHFTTSRFKTASRLRKLLRLQHFSFSVLFQNKVKTLTGSLTAHVIIYSTSIRSGAANTAGSENSMPAEKPTTEK